MNEQVFLAPTHKLKAEEEGIKSEILKLSGNNQYISTFFEPITNIIVESSRIENGLYNMDFDNNSLLESLLGTRCFQGLLSLKLKEIEDDM